MQFEIAIACNVRKSPYFDATVADGVRAFSVYNHMFAPSHFGNPEAEYRALLEVALEAGHASDAALSASVAQFILTKGRSQRFDR